MSTMSRKEREVKKRELLLLDLARKMLIEEGYAGLNMDRLAERAEYSKGTVYGHFSTKEDLLTALAFQSLEARCALFAKTEKFQGRPRERFCALLLADELFGALHPHHYHSELIIKMANLETRASADRRASLHQVQCQCMNHVSAIVEDAVATSDLILPPGLRPGDIAFAGFILAIGTQTALLNFSDVMDTLEVTNPRQVARHAAHAMLDGFDWRPLSTEWDYQSTFDRIAKEVFADECQLAKQVG
jgi:AcrR family transcriptional regulator